MPTRASIVTRKTSITQTDINETLNTKYGKTFMDYYR